MDDQSLKQAYATLGLPEDAAKEVIDEKYFLLLKKGRHDKSIDLEAVSKAYKLIVSHELEKARAAYEEQHYRSPLRSKLDHYWHYYKWHTIGAIVLIIAAVSIVNTALDKRAERIAQANLPPAALEVLFFGQFYNEAETVDAEPVLRHFPDWPRVQIKVAYVPEEARSEFDMAMQQRSVITLMTEKPDLFIVDRVNFDRLAAQGAFLPLEEWFDANLMTDSSRFVKGQREEDEKPRNFGIRIGADSLMQELGIADGGRERIAALRFDAANRENAERFVAWLVRSE